MAINPAGCDPSEIIVKWLHEIWSGQAVEARVSLVMDPYCDRSTTVENLFFELGRSMNDRKSFFFFGIRSRDNLEVYF